MPPASHCHTQPDAGKPGEAGVGEVLWAELQGETEEHRYPGEAEQ